MFILMTNTFEEDTLFLFEVCLLPGCHYEMQSVFNFWCDFRLLDERSDS